MVSYEVGTVYLAMNPTWFDWLPAQVRIIVKILVKIFVKHHKKEQGGCHNPSPDCPTSIQLTVTSTLLTGNYFNPRHSQFHLCCTTAPGKSSIISPCPTSCHTFLASPVNLPHFHSPRPFHSILSLPSTQSTLAHLSPTPQPHADSPHLTQPLPHLTRCK